MNDDIFITGSKVTLTGVPDTVAGGKCANLALRLRSALKGRGKWLTGVRARKPVRDKITTLPTSGTLAYQEITLTQEQIDVLNEAVKNRSARPNLPKSNVRHV